jgi:Na+-driven multidrug efflux pump
MLNAVNKPFISLGLNAARLLLMYIPFAFIGGVYYGLVGVFAGLAFANIVAGIVSLIVERKQITEVGIS